jgi:hypothetical protein
MFQAAGSTVANAAQTVMHLLLRYPKILHLRLMVMVINS